MREVSRQIPSTIMVKRMRDFNSGILKQLLRVLRMELNIYVMTGPVCPAALAGSFAFAFGRRFGLDQLAGASQFLYLGPRGGAERMRPDRQLARQFAVAQDFDPLFPAVGQAQAAQGRLIHRRAVLKVVERLQIDRNVAHGKAGVVKAPFWHAADQGHLAAFKSNPNRTARAGCLALAAAPAGLAVAAGFALAQPLAPMLGAGTRFKIV